MRHTLGNSPEVFTSLDNATIGSIDIFGGSNDRERHSVEKHSGIFSSSLVIGINGRLINADALSGNNLTNLDKVDVSSRDY